MRKTALALAFIISLFVSVLTVALVVKTAKANFWHPAQPMPYMEIKSPQPQVYYSSTVLLDTSTYCDHSVYLEDNTTVNYETIKWLVFNLDGEVQPLEWTFPPNTYAPSLNQSGYAIPYTSYAKANLTDLSDGEHFLMVYGETTFNFSISANVTFAVSTEPIQIDFFSLENKTYSSTSIPLDFVVDRLTSWMGFSLDNQLNMTVYGNTTLTDLSIGSHNLVVYANDTYGNMGVSETLFFTVAEPPEPFPTALVATASGVSMAVVGASLLFYFKKRKH
jgi:hypothetical protein